MSQPSGHDPQPPHRPFRIAWTTDADARLIALREAGLGMRRIAAAIGLSRNAVADRASRLGLREPARHQRECKIEPEPDLTRDSLPPGHPISWTTITANTCLEGQPYHSVKTGPETP